MFTAEIVARLRASMPGGLRRVEPLTGDKRAENTQVVPAAWVVLRTDRHTVGETVTEVTEIYEVYLAWRQQNAPGSVEAADSLEDLVVAVRASLQDWSPSPNCTPMRVQGGSRLLSNDDDGVIWWQDEIETTYLMRPEGVTCP
jgi:hypothetical protein